MSREFGEYSSGGYFHSKILSCVEDLKDEAKQEFHKEFIPLFEELYEIGYAIASVEACDSGLDRSIFQSMESIPKMKKCLDKIEERLEPFRRVAEEAIRQKVR